MIGTYSLSHDLIPLGTKRNCEQELTIVGLETSRDFRSYFILKLIVALRTMKYSRCFAVVN